MPFLVPDDGSYLAEAALMRASEFADALEEDIFVVTVIPEDEANAIQRGWYEETENEPFSVPYVVGKLHKEVTDIAPEATFRYEDTEFESPSLIAERIQEVADDVLPSVFFIGTDNVGEIAEPLTSVAGSVAEDTE